MKKVSRSSAGKLLTLAIVCALGQMFLPPPRIFSQVTDSLLLTFRYGDPAHQKVRVFLPGDFNNWGPNSGGVISPTAPSLMTYDTVTGFWLKQVKLGFGSTHYYKFHFHFDSSGSSFAWIPDPLNPVTDGTQNGNSLITITDPMIFEAVCDTDSTSAVTGVSAGIAAGKPVVSVTVTSGGSPVDITSFLNPVTGIVRYRFPSPLTAGSPVSLSVTDSAGHLAQYRLGRSSSVQVNTVPSWAADAVWYQIFPERFRNGDNSNDPNRMSLETPASVPVSWRISPWTGDWYHRDGWEVAEGGGFYTGVFDRRYGGDLQGVLDKLDYLDSLGINAIYFNPVFWGRSLHKYDPDAYQHIDPFFGPDPHGDSVLMAQETLDSATWHWTRADTLFLRVIREAHRRGMKVIIDGVFDHTGRDFYAFKDLVKNQQSSPYQSWYTVYSWYDPNVPGSQFTYKSWHGFTPMPEFATTADATNLAPGPKQHIFTITRRWMDPNGDGDPSDGIDGWRLDTVPDVPIGFWTDWNTLVRTINPQAYTTAEVWSDATFAIQQGRFSATMNYAACMMPVYDCIVRNVVTPTDFVNSIISYLERYGPDVACANQNLADSHDTERLASMIVNAPQSTGYGSDNSPNGNSAYLLRKPVARERAIQRLAVLAQATLPGAPMFYYGDEAGMWGATDPDDRMPMTWPDLPVIPQATDPRGGTRTPDNMNFDSSVYSFYRSVVNLRHSSTSLRRGGLALLSAIDTANAFAYLRSGTGEATVTAMNRADHSVQLTIPVSELPSNSVFGMVFSTAPDSAPAGFALQPSSLQISLPALTGVVIRVVPSVPASVPQTAGWNLVSVPVAVQDRRAASIFPSRISPLFGYLNGYVISDTLAAGAGYWLNLASAQTLQFSGGWITADTVPVRKGWNLIGGISVPVAASSLMSVPAGMTTSPCYSYHGNYQAADTLRPGTGYWIKTDRDGEIICAVQTEAAGRIRIIPGQELPPAPPTAGKGAGSGLPRSFALDQNYPNPFNPSTRISFALPVKSRVSMDIYSVLGEKVATLVDEIREGGYYSIAWSPVCASGLYFCRFSAKPVDGVSRPVTIVRKMMFLK